MVGSRPIFTEMVEDQKIFSSQVWRESLTMLWPGGSYITLRYPPTRSARLGAGPVRSVLIWRPATSAPKLSLDPPVRGRWRFSEARHRMASDVKRFLMLMLTLMLTAYADGRIVGLGCWESTNAAGWPHLHVACQHIERPVRRGQSVNNKQKQDRSARY